MSENTLYLKWNLFSYHEEQLEKTRPQIFVLNLLLPRAVCSQQSKERKLGPKCIATAVRSLVRSFPLTYMRACFLRADLNEVVREPLWTAKQGNGTV